MDMEKMEKEAVITRGRDEEGTAIILDCNGEEVTIGTPVCVLTSGNFIFGHVTAISEGQATVKPDIGYNTTKPNFRLKKEYIATSDMIGVVNVPGDVIVDEYCKEVPLD